MPNVKRPAEIEIATVVILAVARLLHLPQIRHEPAYRQRLMGRETEHWSRIDFVRLPLRSRCIIDLSWRQGCDQIGNIQATNKQRDPPGIRLAANKQSDEIVRRGIVVR